jgi:hypothetical protein
VKPGRWDGWDAVSGGGGGAAGTCQDREMEW